MQHGEHRVTINGAGAHAQAICLGNLECAVLVLSFDPLRGRIWPLEDTKTTSDTSGMLCCEPVLHCLGASILAA